MVDEYYYMHYNYNYIWIMHLEQFVGLISVKNVDFKICIEYLYRIPKCKMYSVIWVCQVMRILVTLSETKSKSYLSLYVQHALWFLLCKSFQLYIAFKYIVFTKANKIRMRKCICRELFVKFIFFIYNISTGLN